MTQPRLHLRYVGRPCAYCGQEMHYRGGADIQRRPTRDHALPRALGYTLVAWNCIIVCHQCNADKGSMTLESFWVRLKEIGDLTRASLVEAIIREKFWEPRYSGLDRPLTSNKKASLRWNVWKELGLIDAEPPEPPGRNMEPEPSPPARARPHIPEPYVGKLINPMSERMA